VLRQGKDGDTVISDLEARESGQRLSVRSRHVVGCDGARSQVRKHLGVGSEGEDGCKFLRLMAFYACINH
jgi:2-polyprenyl-6-methoxyphenol hydroxylase-like FAD-dependent oxidoreductase